ncbi:sensor histidine kinase [Ectothiorhodospira sp. BSL-9]|uniref:sensor histidine kinase n=1 Tax=Ectothiorhodospira sp. BSL-9 TaxID=1442136 RepID=UPI0007B446C2|nr:sensor histidine kinase [Ectothiorhodospira sp. BSL-9]ANB01811.1 histidine kinase [Ectothiorhodospira sp. BSL-9]TVQ73761.1 MAG: histidine kinase [Chromatiaceae bacterium]
MNIGLVIGVSLGYLLLLFGIAYWGDKRSDQGRSIINSPYVYALSIAVYCTSWTFYGSVGLAAEGGIHYLPIYLGPTLMAALFWIVLRKMVRISKVNRITSIADFVASRYGKSQMLGGLVTIIALVGLVPYIALQLRAVSDTFNVMVSYPDTSASQLAHTVPFYADTAFYVALILAAFAILFGTRHIDASEHHSGMVAAIAFESVVKLVAFILAGLVVTFVIFGGVGDLFSQAAAHPQLAELFHVGELSDYGNWIAFTLLAMVVVLVLPRQFQVAVVENVDESHVRKAAWLFPLYLFLINLFVLPIAFAGVLMFGYGEVNPDNFVLALPLSQEMQLLALIVFLGGLSAATAMIIVETVALATMLCNDLVMPALLRIRWLGLERRRDLTRLLLYIRRGAILIGILLGYAYVRVTGDMVGLVSMGLVSFCAVAQFAPALIGGIFWKGATRKGALAGLTAGFVVWLYTLLLPSFAQAGWLPATFITHGPWGIELLKPYELFGLSGLHQITHSLVWSMLVNLGAYVTVSLLTQQNTMERIQANLFVDVFRLSAERYGTSRFWRGTATVDDLFDLLKRFVGEARARRAFEHYARGRGLDLAKMREADSDLIQMCERMLAGSIGAASARVMVSNVAKGDVVSLEEVMEILDEASQVIAYSQQLETKSRELETATRELRAANEQLKQLDRMKDDFISTVTHELRTPLTSIRSFTEILYDNRDLDPDKRQEFLGIIISESERLTRLINQVLDLAKLESGAMRWYIRPYDLVDILSDAATATSQLFKTKAVDLRLDLPDHPVHMDTDRDRLMQVIINLLSNAVKFTPAHTGRVTLRLTPLEEGGVKVEVEDNGPGIPTEDLPTLFEKFRQVGDALTEKPEGTGLGLAICKNIIQHLGGRIWVDSQQGAGATFAFNLPLLDSPGGEAQESPKPE